MIHVLQKRGGTVMEDKKNLNEEQLAQVSGGTGDSYDPNGHVCPACGSSKVKLIGERGDFGMYKCDDCGSEFYADV